MQQEHVNAHFDSTASYWEEVYRGGGLQGLIYRRRQAAVLELADPAALPPSARVLEIGCGAGLLTVELARTRSDLRIDAVDASEEMTRSTAERARAEGLSEQIAAAVADVHALPFATGHFDLVIAVGVIPWLHDPGGAIAEMARVLRPGGRLVLTADNRARLTSFTDPRAMLALSPLRGVLVARRARRGLASSRLDSPRRIDRLVLDAGLRPLGRRTIGFGPLTLLGRPLFGERRAVRIDDRLQRRADQGAAPFRWTGWHYVVSATKP
ncbi:MAG TPA: methyltransferase domain-containing protein [Solirubrobacteraceae bacterium]|jgi:ubiquinone/menaquinone biosynthesis C-methylase UbiE|nr:methyltransferase domain-containing protein [Solirubrobacteraceae bacterium]